MNDVPDTELFSAYLDGELTADEQVRVEQILATSPEPGNCWRNCARWPAPCKACPGKLDEDLSARVLQIASCGCCCPPTRATSRRRRAAEALKGPEADSIGWLGVPWREISWRGMFSKRALIWSAVVVATAIIISFTSPPPPKGNHELAKLDRKPAADALAVSGADRTKSSTSDESWDVPAGERRKLGHDDRAAKDESGKLGDLREREALKVRHDTGD